MLYLDEQIMYVVFYEFILIGWKKLELAKGFPI